MSDLTFESSLIFGNPALAKIFAKLPLEQAMPELLPQSTADRFFLEDVEEIVDTQSETIQAALWLYVDDINRSHFVSQSINSIEGSFWHGIMHRREGDFSNANYWFRRAGSLPSRLGLDPFTLTDEVALLPKGENPEHLVEAQRREWFLLANHCARQTA